MWDPDISISQTSPKRFHCAVQFGNQHTTFSPGTVPFTILEELYDSWVSVSPSVVKTLQVWQTRIYPLQAQGRRVLMPQNFELRALEGNLLLQSQLELGDPTPSWACCKTFIMFISTGFCATTNTNLQPQGSDAASHVHHHLWVNQLGVLHKIQWNHNGVGSLGCCQGNKGKRILEEDAVAWWKLGQFYFSPRPGNQPHPCFGNCPPVPPQQEAKCLLCSPFWAWGSKV